MGRAGSALARVGIVLSLVAAGTGCDGCGGKAKKGSGGDEDPGARASAEAADAAAHAVLAKPGCHPTMAGGTLAKVTPGALSIAAVRDRALLVGAGSEAPGDARADGGGGAGGRKAAMRRSEYVILDRMGAPIRAAEAATDGLPAAPGTSTLAAAFPLDGHLETLTYGTSRPSATACDAGSLMARVVEPAGPGREILAHACRFDSMLVASARASLGIAFVDGATKEDGDPHAAAAMADAVVIDSLASAQVRLESIAGATIANAATATGSTSVGAAYVVAHGDVRELHVVQIDREGKPRTKVEVLEKQNVGTVSVAYEGDTLHVVWSSFAQDKNRYVLRWMKWLAGTPPTAPQTIGTGVLPALWPALAIDHGRFLLAWANGDERSATVKVGASKNGIVFLPGLANVVSTAGVAAREPVVALDGDAMFVAWKELGTAEPEVHATSISCRE